MELLSIDKIWDYSEHNAFTDLILFKDKWYCCFREANGHMSFDGAIRVICSEDGKNWESFDLLKVKDFDLRDPKFSITPKNELMINIGTRIEVVKDTKMPRSMTFFLADDKKFIGPFLCSKNPDTWRWSTSWHNNIAYSFAYTGKHKKGALYISTDGKDWELHKNNVHPLSSTSEWGNESSLVFINDLAYCLLRRDGGDSSAVFAISKPPYKKWDWKNLGQYVGGPKMIEINGKLLVSGRLSNTQEYYTALAWLDIENMKLEEALKLPSQLDSSYPGLVYKDGIVFVSYYSSHEGKSSIYFAKVKI